MPFLLAPLPIKATPYSRFSSLTLLRSSIQSKTLNAVLVSSILSNSMHPKRSTVLRDPPAASSSEEEEATSRGEEEEVESLSSDEETEAPLSGLVSKATTRKPASSDTEADSNADADANVEAEAESESKSDSGSESDQPDNTADPTVNAIASKPTEETLNKKPRSSAAAPGSSKSAVKRGSEAELEPKDTKRAKMKELETEGAIVKVGEKKNLFQRLWSVDDEITILRGIIQFTAKRGVDPVKDMNGFYNFIKKKLLHLDFTLPQLVSKFRRLRRKFKNQAKGKKGEARTFSNAPLQNAFDLSKKIWGGERPSGVGESSAKSNGKANKVNTKSLFSSRAVVLSETPKGGAESSVRSIGKAKKGNAKSKAELGIGDAAAEKEREKVDIDMAMKDFGKGVDQMEEHVLKRGLDTLKGTNKVEIEDKWRKLHVEEMQLHLKRLALMGEQGQLILAAYQSAKD